MPNVPPPEQCLLEEEWLLQLTESEIAEVHPKLKEFFQILAAVSVEAAAGMLNSNQGAVRIRQRVPLPSNAQRYMTSVQTGQ
jgi:hypothetical protein